jgi:hypothetical protein
MAGRKQPKYSGEGKDIQSRLQRFSGLKNAHVRKMKKLRESPADAERARDLSLNLAWQGRLGLQNRLTRFNSGRGLQLNK